LDRYSSYRSTADTLLQSGPSPSELNKRIILQYKTQVSDGKAGVDITWNTAATVWARMTTLSTTNAIIAMKTTGTLIHNILIRYRSDIASGRFQWRIKFGDVYYQVLGKPIDINQAHRWLDMKVQETTP